LVKFSLEFIEIRREVSFDFFLGLLLHLGDVLFGPLVHGLADRIGDAFPLLHDLEVLKDTVDHVLFCELLGNLSANKIF